MNQNTYDTYITLKKIAEGSFRMKCVQNQGKVRVHKSQTSEKLQTQKKSYHSANYMHTHITDLL